MSCGFDQEKLSGFLDGELDAAGKAEVERHIGACSGCLRELGELKASVQLVKGLPRLRAPRSVAEGVSRGISASGGRIHVFESQRRRLWWLTAAAAAVFVAANLSYFIGAPREAAPEAAPLIGAAGTSREGKDETSVAGKELKDLAKQSDPAGARKAVSEELSDRRHPEGRGAAPAPLPQEAKPAPGRPEEPQAARERLEKKAAEAPRAVAAAPAPSTPPPAPPAAAPRPTAARAPLEAETVPPAVVPPVLTLASTELAKARASYEEILRKYAAPSPKQEENPALRRSAAPVREFILELTPGQYESLKRELEALGRVRLLPLGPADSALAAYLPEAERRQAEGVSKGGAPAGKAKEFGGQAASSVAKDRESSARTVVLHLLEVVELPAADAGPQK